MQRLRDPVQKEQRPKKKDGEEKENGKEKEKKKKRGWNSEVPGKGSTGFAVANKDESKVIYVVSKQVQYVVVNVHGERHREWQEGAVEEGLKDEVYEVGSSILKRMDNLERDLRAVCEKVQREVEDKLEQLSDQFFGGVDPGEKECQGKEEVEDLHKHDRCKGCEMLAEVKTTACYKGCGRGWCAWILFVSAWLAGLCCHLGDKGSALILKSYKDGAGLSGMVGTSRERASYKERLDKEVERIKDNGKRIAKNKLQQEGSWENSGGAGKVATKKGSYEQALDREIKKYYIEQARKQSTAKKK